MLTPPRRLSRETPQVAAEHPAPRLDLSDKGHWSLREFHSAVGRAFRKLVCPVPAALEGPTGPLGSRSCGEEGRHRGARSAEPRAAILGTPV